MPNETMNKLQVMSEMSIHELWVIASAPDDYDDDDEFGTGVPVRAQGGDWVDIEPQDAKDFLRTMRSFLNSPDVHSVIREL